MSEPQSSAAMNDLVKFMICLAVLGALLALGFGYMSANPNMIPPLNC